MTFPTESRPRVVIADDHPYVLLGLTRMLQLSCHVVDSVSCGLEAVDAVSRLRPDVLVVDLIMPDLDGLEVCRRVKRLAPDTDVILITAFDDEHVETIAAREGVSAFVPKHSAALALEPAIQALYEEQQRRRAHPAANESA